MAFDSLSDRLQDILSKVSGKGKLNEVDINDVLKEVRLALLEADVNYKVVKNFTARIKERALGVEVLSSLTPGQHVVKIVHEELTQLMGAEEAKISFSSKGLTIIMLVGLQGSGKTTTCGKLAYHLKQKLHKNPLLVACDVYRPAAIKQLMVLGEQLSIPVFKDESLSNVLEIASNSIDFANKNRNDVIIIDTAGRLHIDEYLMEELKGLSSLVNPSEILLVVDAMTGQDAVTIAGDFDKELSLSGLILTKLDGDTRGGVALSVKEVTGKPIKFVGSGEKLDALEVFYPERMASRILGMGDVLSLIEKAQESFDEEAAKTLQDKILSATFTLDDYLHQMEQMQSMGDIDSILGMLPGVSKKALKNAKIDVNEMVRSKAIILSMTKEERINYKLINGSRRKRIAVGSGVRVQDVNRLIKQFEQSQTLMKQLSTMNSTKGHKKKMPFFGI